MREFRRGASASPKFIIEAELGTFLLKRRARGLDDPFRVAFDHEVQLKLRELGFPAPRLVGTRDDNNSMLQIDGRVHELFVFVKGDRFDASTNHCRQAGRSLGRLHRLLTGFKPSWPTGPARGDGRAVVEAAVVKLSPVSSDLARIVEDLAGLFERSREASANRTAPQPVIVHGDWHPGNMLFGPTATAGVFDYDNARVDDPGDDLGQGLAQFSIMHEGTDPAAWSDPADLDRLGAFWLGYTGAADARPAGPADAGHLMARSLILEVCESASPAVSPILLGAVARKVRWLLDQGDQIADALANAENSRDQPPESQ